MGGCCAKAEKAVEPLLQEFIQKEIAKASQQLKLHLLEYIEQQVKAEIATTEKNDG
jgi:hypothetical protein